jgi:hypothetical protein
MVNAREHDLLPGTLFDWRTDLDVDERLARVPVLAAALVDLVDQGLIEVRRFVPGDDGHGEVVSRDRLPAVLADRAVWQYSDRAWLHRDEGLALRETPAGRELTRTDHSGTPDPQASNPHRQPSS